MKSSARFSSRRRPLGRLEFTAASARELIGEVDPAPCASWRVSSTPSTSAAAAVPEPAAILLAESSPLA